MTDHIQSRGVRRHSPGTYYPELEDINHYETEDNILNEYNSDQADHAHTDNMVQRYRRLAAGSADPDNIKKYREKLKYWEYIRVKQVDKDRERSIIEKIKRLGSFPKNAKVHIKSKEKELSEKINISELTFDDKHINKERQHNITLEEAKKWIRNAKIYVERWNGKYINFYGTNGAVYVNTEKNMIRTAYGKEEFDEKIKAILEVLKKYGY